MNPLLSACPAGPRRFHGLLFFILQAIVVSAGIPFAVAAEPAAETDPALDWTDWRGPTLDNASTQTNLPEKWDPKGGDGSNLVWKRSDLGTRSTPIVMRGKLYVLVRDKPGTENEGEKVVCCDAATGEQLWQHRIEVYLTEVPDTRVAWSSVCGDPETGRVYAQSVCGVFVCLEGDTGKVVWQRALHEQMGVITTYGGRTNIPIVHEDLVLISAVLVSWGDTPEFDGLARPAHRFMGFDKATGELRWLGSTSISPPDTTYSTPFVGVVGGESQLIFGGADGRVWGMQPRTGKPLWNYPLSRRGLNVSPLVDNDVVYCSHSEENITGTTTGAICAIDPKLRGELTGKEKWLTYAVASGKSSPVMVEGKLWSIDDSAKLQILDPATGKRLGKKALGAMQRSTPLVADGKVYACTNFGQWYIMKPQGNGATFIHKLRLAGHENDGSPIVAQGRIYLPTSDAIYCIGVKDSKPTAGPLPERKQEPSVEEDSTPALVQLVPYEATLQPAKTQEFHVRLYNARGQFLRAAKPEEVKFTVTGPGSVTPAGVYTAPKRQGHVGSLVLAQVGQLTGKSRVRIVPPLPWQFDFNKDQDLPITWVGGRVRYVLQDIDGERAAMKRSVLPTPTRPNNKLGTNSKLFMGPSDLDNYTIQGDVRLTETDARLPDVGLINSGYTMSILTQNEELRVYSWSAHEYRTFAAAKFSAEPGKWYRMKLRVEQKKESALVQGKMWLRDQPEPKEWTVEMTDKTPITSGSPGVYGKSQETEFYIDNLVVTKNE